MIFSLMANAAPTGGGDGVWLSVAAITAIGAAVIGVVKAFKAGEAKGKSSQEFTLKKPVPTVVTREEPAWATKPELEDHEERTKAEFAQLWEAIDGERKIARDALGRIHGRLDKQSEATAKVQGTVDEVKSNVSKLLDIALQRKPGTRQ
jgi:hypothetical protein